jgi:hypothetical protein
MDSMANVKGGKLYWTTTTGFLSLRVLLGSKSGDGGDINTSGRGNREPMLYALL